MDPIAISTLIVLGSSIFETLLKYADPEMKAVERAEWAKQWVEFQKLSELPEEYDVGFVESIKEKVNAFVGAHKK